MAGGLATQGGAALPCPAESLGQAGDVNRQRSQVAVSEPADAIVVVNA